jgi:hypothetical protein
MSIRSHGKRLGLPSEDPARKEVVLLLGEAHGTRKDKFLPILRSESGSFRGFGDSDSFSWDSIEGRFTNIVPPRSPSPEAQAQAKQLLDAMGVTAPLLEVMPARP